VKKDIRDNAAQMKPGLGKAMEISETESDGHVLVESAKKKPGKGWTTKKIVLVSVLGALVLLLAGVGAWVYSIWSNPMGQFNTIAGQMPLPTPQVSDAGGDVPDPLDAFQGQTGYLKDTVNILLIGVDHSEQRDSAEWINSGGKRAFHADVMLVLSINKATNTINMISLPRDTYAKIPGVEGIYKLNASIDCGGGWPTESNNYSTSGFDKVCEAASWMLGGIPVQYYYAVDMNAVKDLVDAIGGVQDFDVEMNFELDGHTYKKGVQDMDGLAVLDYLRVRKHIASSGDLNRINRQKKMLVAIFDKIKKNGLLTSIPGLLDTFDGNLYTNVPLASTAALAVYASNIDAENIGMYSMGGKYNYGIFNWNFVITDQEARVELIKQIYGVDVEPYADYTPEAAERRWEEIRARYIKVQAEKALELVEARLNGKTSSQYDKATSACASLGTQATTEAMKKASDQVISAVKSLCRKHGVSLSDGYWRVNYESDSSFNQVWVDFN
jgi:LCP family protein required for cell wall assembly